MATTRSTRPVPPGDWPENAEPTPEQWTAWFVGLPLDDQHAVASRVLDNGRIVVDCFVRHGGRGHPSPAHREVAAQPDYTERERAALGATPGICRAIDPTGKFMCDRESGHDGDHNGFELPTVTLDEAL